MVHVLNHTNYARWLPVHVRDMVQLSKRHPQVYSEFLKGNFVVQRSLHKFSLIEKDQYHEQYSSFLMSLQAPGSAVGLCENPKALILFMLAGPDCSRCIEEYEAMLDTANSSTAPYEEAQTHQRKYKTDVLSFVQIAKEQGNPYYDSCELVALHTQEAMEVEVVTSLSKLHE